MELDIQQSTDYIGQLTQSAGIRMVLHKQGEEPFPEDDGFNLSPAFKTYVGIRQVRITLRRQACCLRVCNMRWWTVQ